MNAPPSNNELQLTSGAEKLGRRSQLNSVFGGLKGGSADGNTAPTLVQTQER